MWWPSRRRPLLSWSWLDLAIGSARPETSWWRTWLRLAMRFHREPFRSSWRASWRKSETGSSLLHCHRSLSFRPIRSIVHAPAASPLPSRSDQTGPSQVSASKRFGRRRRRRNSEWHASCRYWTLRSICRYDWGSHPCSRQEKSTSSPSWTNWSLRSSMRLAQGPQSCPNSSTWNKSWISKVTLPPTWRQTFHLERCRRFGPGSTSKSSVGSVFLARPWSARLQFCSWICCTHPAPQNNHPESKMAPANCDNSTEAILAYPMIEFFY